MSGTESLIVTAYRRRTPSSERLALAAAEVFPSGITHDSRYLQPYPIYVSRAQGAHKWDVDDNEYVDYAGGHGALLLGHNPPAVVAAVQEQLARGTHYGASHELELEWGRAVQKLVPSAERVRFTNSGTEATLLAVRLARAFTGKPKLIRLLGHFHGWHDHMAFGVSGPWDGKSPPGVLADLTEQVVLCPSQDISTLADVLHSRDDIAALILEPTGGSWGQIPLPANYVQQARALTEKHNVLLILDEVITGFRCSPSGAQGILNVRPDLSTFAKIIAGGLPGGALTGRKDILDAIEFGGPRPKVVHQGTFNANPLCAAAGIAMLKLVAETDACQKANDYAARLRKEMNAVLASESVPWVVHGSYSGFHIFTNPDRLDLTPEQIEAGTLSVSQLKAGRSGPLSHKLRLAMLLHGVEFFSWPGGPTSAVHTGADLEQTVAAFRAALRMLKDDGALG